MTAWPLQVARSCLVPSRILDTFLPFSHLISAGVTANATVLPLCKQKQPHPETGFDSIVGECHTSFHRSSCLVKLQCKNHEHDPMQLYFPTHQQGVIRASDIPHYIVVARNTWYQAAAPPLATCLSFPIFPYVMFFPHPFVRASTAFNARTPSHRSPRLRALEDCINESQRSIY